MNSKEAGVVVGHDGKPIYWHLPVERTVASLPDSRKLWDIFWDNRKNIAGFAHSHPGRGLPAPSWTDITTFVAIETGLGCRLVWWITSEDAAISLVWSGPNPNDYAISAMLDVPEWLTSLRRVSAEVLRGGTNLAAMIDDPIHFNKDR